jgi:hypothetical protein
MVVPVPDVGSATGLDGGDGRTAVPEPVGARVGTGDAAAPAPGAAAPDAPGGVAGVVVVVAARARN